MDSVFNSQAFTQATQPRRGGGTEKFVDSLIKVRCNHPDGLDSISESLRQVVVKNFRSLENDNKWAALGRLLIEMCSDDRGGRLFEFTHTIFFLSPLLPDVVEKDKLILKTIKFLIDVLIRADVSVPNFFGMYNDLMVQLENLTTRGIVGLVDHITGQLEEKKEGTEDIENSQTMLKEQKMFNQRWKDFVAVLIKKIRALPELEYHLEALSGQDAADVILFNWLRLTEDVDAFFLLADVASGSKSIDRFCDEVVAEEIGVSPDANDVEGERRRRASLTWKSVILTVKVDKERMNRLWNGVICAWEISEEVEIEKKETKEFSEGLEKCLLVGNRVLSGNVEAAKKFLAIIKTEKYRVLSSEFGLALSLVQCGLDRNDGLLEMKRTLQKLFRVAEQAEECAWMSSIVTGRLVRLVDLQFRILSERLHKIPDLRRLLTRPLISLMLSLLDSPAHQKQVVIVDGKVADGCALWLLSRDILSVVLTNQQFQMGPLLSHLLQAIASASSNPGALVLIDVLRELVRKCSVEVLNNSKLIDGLFDYVCRMRKDVSVSLIRCLLPIINTRPQLRTSLFKSLKKDLLCESTVCSAVPIVLMLLRSVSKRREDGGGGQFDHSMSQSFGSFSTQTLNSMGLKKYMDHSVGLELVGIVKRCLWQPAATRIALYDGICELATQTTTMLNQFLDIIVSHSMTIPEWTKGEMTMNGGAAGPQLVEPLPHLIQTVECLISELSSFDPEFLLDGTELLLKNATAQMEKWVLNAMRSDVSDLGLDRNTEWTTGTSNGKSSLLFAQMMLSTYDALIEHVWRRVEAMSKKDDCEKLMVLLHRRKELEAVYKEKTMKVTGNVETGHQEVLTSAKSLSSIMSKLMAEDQQEILMDLKMELMGWTVGRAKTLSGAIVKEYRPLHSILTGTNSLMSLSKSLLDFYTGNSCPPWITEIETGTQMKTFAIESYANILQHLTLKYKLSPSRVAMMWFEPKEGEDEETAKKRQEPTILVLRQAHYLSCRLFRQVLDVENEEIEEEKRPKVQFEMQSKAILKAASAVLGMTKHVNVWTNLFKRLMKLLEDETFYNNQMLKDYSKFVTTCALKCSDSSTSSEKSTSSEMITIMENILEFLSEESEEIKYHFISKTTLNIAIEFLFGYVEDSLTLIREAFGFQKDFFVKPPIFDGMLCSLLEKCMEITELISRVLQIFVQYKMMQERVTEIMTQYFSTINLGVLLLQNITKGWGREMSEWSSVCLLATLVKTKLTPILGMVDDHIGFSRGSDEMKKKISQKTRMAKSKRDEKLFSKFSHERETVQHSILVLCKLIKDDRFDLQIKNNSIGYRDFRIDMAVIRSKLGGESNDEPQEPREPSSKRRRQQQRGEEEEEEEDRNSTTPDDETTRGSGGGVENQDEDMEQNEEDEEDEEAPRGDPSLSAVVKQEIEDEDVEDEDNDRSTSPVF